MPAQEPIPLRAYLPWFAVWVPLGLLLVAADDVASPPLPRADHHLFDLEGLVDPPEAAGPRQHLLLDLFELAERHREDGVTEALGQLAPIGLRVHPRVAHEDGAAGPARLLSPR